MPAETIAPTDLDTLQQLNRDYITSVQTSDVRRFDQILAEDFCAATPTARWSTVRPSWPRRPGR